MGAIILQVMIAVNKIFLMKAIILAAGQAKRLRPITKDTPKCLLKIGGVSIIDHQLNCLKRNNIKNVLVVVGFKSKKLTTHLLKKHPDIDFEFIINDNYKNTNAAYSLWLAKGHLKESVIYLNSDCFFHPKIAEIVIKSKKDSLTAIQRVPWDEEEVNVKVNKKLLVMEIGKHLMAEESFGEFIGFTKLGKKFNQQLTEALDFFVAQKEYKKFAADAINLTIKNLQGKMYIADVTNWPATEIDTIKDFERAREVWDKYRYES